MQRGDCKFVFVPLSVTEIHMEWASRTTVSSSVFQATFANPVFLTFAQSSLCQIRWSQRITLHSFNSSLKQQSSCSSEFQTNPFTSVPRVIELPWSFSFLDQGPCEIPRDLFAFFFFSPSFKFFCFVLYLL